MKLLVVGCAAQIEYYRCKSIGPFSSQHAHVALFLPASDTPRHRERTLSIGCLAWIYQPCCNPFRVISTDMIVVREY